MERYFLIDKEMAARAALDDTLRTEIDGKLLLSEKDIRNITLTIDEKVAAMGGVEYVEPETVTE
ncbi:MAG: hypothetical protein VB054_04880 [Petrimonas sp.]|jgi:hypothetical protein|nr:hypothetical protein [Petrimonas sp.]